MKYILSYMFYQQTRARSTDRYKEATRAVCAGEEVAGEEFEPCIVSIEHDLAAFGTDLRQPGILAREGGRCIALGEVQDKIEE
jgi:hypothetical protein